METSEGAPGPSAHAVRERGEARPASAADRCPPAGPHRRERGSRRSVFRRRRTGTVGQPEAPLLAQLRRAPALRNHHSSTGRLARVSKGVAFRPKECEMEWARLNGDPEDRPAGSKDALPAVDLFQLGGDEPQRQRGHGQVIQPAEDGSRESRKKIDGAQEVKQSEEEEILRRGHDARIHQKS